MPEGCLEAYAADHIEVPGISIKNKPGGLNAIIKQTSKKQKKIIQQKSLLKLLDFQVFQQREAHADCIARPNNSSFIWKLKYDFLRFASFMPMGGNNSEIEDLANRLEQFKSLTRFSNIRRSKSMVHAKRKSFPPLLCQIQESKSQTKADPDSEQNGDDIIRKNSQPNEVQNQGSLSIRQYEKNQNSYRGNLQLDLSNILNIEYQPLDFQFYEQN